MNHSFYPWDFFRDSVSFPPKIAFEGLSDLSPFPVTCVPHNPCIPDAKSAVFIENFIRFGQTACRNAKIRERSFSDEIEQRYDVFLENPKFLKICGFWVP